MGDEGARARRGGKGMSDRCLLRNGLVIGGLLHVPYQVRGSNVIGIIGAMGMFQEMCVLICRCLGDGRGLQNKGRGTMDCD